MRRGARSEDTPMDAYAYSRGCHEQAHDAVRQAMACARATLTDARGAIDDLRATSVPEQDLPEVIKDNIRRVMSATGIACCCDVELLASLPATLADQAVRAIMEGVTNVARHARATRLWVSVTHEGTDVAVEVRDDGIALTRPKWPSRPVITGCWVCASERGRRAAS